MANIAKLHLLLKHLDEAIKSRDLTQALSFQQEFDDLLKKTTFSLESGNDLNFFSERYSFLMGEVMILQSQSKVDIARFKSNTKKIAKYNL